MALRPKPAFALLFSQIEILKQIASKFEIRYDWAILVLSMPPGEYLCKGPVVLRGDRTDAVRGSLVMSPKYVMGCRFEFWAGNELRFNVRIYPDTHPRSLPCPSESSTIMLTPTFPHESGDIINPGKPSLVFLADLVHTSVAARVPVFGTWNRPSRALSLASSTLAL